MQISKLFKWTKHRSFISIGIPRSLSTKSASVDDAEIDKFSRIADNWWDPDGEFKPLHAMNPVRMSYITHWIKCKSPAICRGDKVSVLDLGCGGGLLSEALAKCGYNVLGVDASSISVGVADAHRLKMASSLSSNSQPPRSPLSAASSLSYRNATAEQLVEEKASFDVVCSLEVVEHVRDPAEFVNLCLRLVKPGGLLFLSTINRTAKALLLDIVIPEYVLRWIPPGTHQLHKFITPAELEAFVTAGGGRVQHTCGMTFNPISFQWSLDSEDIQANYILIAKRPEEADEL